MPASIDMNPGYFEFPQAWNAQDLADAVPRRVRLSQMIDFDALRDGVQACANAPQRALQRGYLHVPALARLFRVG
ncbi:MAG TPA: hypothetical protein VM619_03930 [Luteimonas sp.]|nr:hypothetical protein [Luteimonas sp.]